MLKNIIKIIGVLVVIAIIVWIICYWLVSRGVLGSRIYIAVYAVPMLCWAIYAHIKNQMYK
jgi:predicted ABC-type sugar transport system permease subunit